MSAASNIPQPSPPAPKAASGTGLARAALALSIFAIIPPLGIAAVVLGHMVETRIKTDVGNPDAKVPARAALWIAYLQLALALATGMIGWTIFHEMADGFQRDVLVQRAFRSADQTRPLDPDSAREAEGTVDTLMFQLIALQDQFRRRNANGLYSCQVQEILAYGVEGSTSAEKFALQSRVLEAPYIFAVSRCNPNTNGKITPGYVITAVPRIPRMPQDSPIFCAYEDGDVRRVMGRTSLDCLNARDLAH